MKGVLICGGTGSRLKPLTEVTNKSLLPVYDRPLVLYPLETLLRAGIRDITIISGTEHIDQMASFLGSGNRFGCSFSYRVQEKPAGIAQALGMAEAFVGDDSVCTILGDNVYFDDLSESICSFKTGGHIFLKAVPDPERFGVAEVAMSYERLAVRKKGNILSSQSSQLTAHSSLQVLSIEEKPKHPKSNLALTGCYLFDNRCFSVIHSLKPSWRNELEITDVCKWYLRQRELSASLLEHEWIDAGTFESLFQAASLIRQKKMAPLLKHEKLRKFAEAPRRAVRTAAQ